MGRISALIELTSLASDDYLVVLDSSANIAKKITVANAFGIPDLGWTASGESWTYSTWSSTTRIGVITVPTDATVKYIAGMRVKITQSTGGVKYGIIHAVSATTLTIFFPSGTTLNNEAITSPSYSIADSPIGFDKDPSLWSLESNVTTDSTQATPTTGTWYNLGSQSLSVGIGKYYLYSKLSSGADRAANGRTDYSTTISTSSSSESSSKYTTGSANSNVTFTGATDTVREPITLASASTLYALIKSNIAGASTLFFFGSGSTIGGSRIIRVTSAYL